MRAFRAIDGAGMARCDFFLERRTNKIFINELNTIPGFTSISMYPKLWEASGLPYTKLIDRLIELALELHAREGSHQVFNRTAGWLVRRSRRLKLAPKQNLFPSRNTRVKRSATLTAGMPLLKLTV